MFLFWSNLQFILKQTENQPRIVGLDSKFLSAQNLNSWGNYALIKEQFAHFHKEVFQNIGMKNFCSYKLLKFVRLGVENVPEIKTYEEE